MSLFDSIWNHKHKHFLVCFLLLHDIYIYIYIYIYISHSLYIYMNTCPLIPMYVKMSKGNVDDRNMDWTNQRNEMSKLILMAIAKTCDSSKSNGNWSNVFESSLMFGCIFIGFQDLWNLTSYDFITATTLSDREMDEYTCKEYQTAQELSIGLMSNWSL